MKTKGTFIVCLVLLLICTSECRLTSIFYSASNFTAAMTGVNQMQSWIGKRFAVFNMFTDFCPSSQSHVFQTLLANSWANNLIPSLTWQMASCPSQAGITKYINLGNYDSYINQYATNVKTFLSGPDGVYGTDDDRRLYIRLAHEMNGNWYNWSAPTGGSNTTDYVNAWIRIRRIFTSHGMESTRLQWIWCVSANDASTSYTAEMYYPGDEYVDWIGIDGYNFGTTASWSSWQMPSQVYGPMLTRLRKLAPSKLFMMNEVGTTSYGPWGGYNVGNKTDWLVALCQYIKAQDFRVSAYFNIDKETDWAIWGGARGSEITNSVYTYHAYKDCYNTLTDWVTPDLSNPRLITDYQFMTGLTPTCWNIAATNTAVCSGRGSCLTPDTCTCNAGYGGSQCQYPTCYGVNSTSSTVCSGNGACVNLNTCVCNSGYSGAQCQYPSCYGINSTSPSVCTNGNGACVAKDTCSCNAGYTGSQCQIPICNGKLATDSSVCNNQNGTCIKANTCACNAGYTGTNCDIPICNGIPANQSNVCNNGNGKCIAYNTCSCNSGYTGTYCAIPICYSIAATSSAVCNNGNGTCVSANNCRCNSGYIGNQCQVPTCYGVAGNASAVCNGNGACVKQDSCVCNSGFVGNQCQTQVSVQNCNNGTYVSSVQRCTCPPLCTGTYCENCCSTCGTPVIQSPYTDGTNFYAPPFPGRSSYTFVFGSGANNCTQVSTTNGPVVFANATSYGNYIIYSPFSYISCFNSTIVGNNAIYSGILSLQATDPIYTSVGTWYKSITYELPMQVTVPIRVSVQSSLQTVVYGSSSLTLIADITSQRVDIPSRTVYLEITTSVNYPAYVTSLSHYSWPSSVNGNAMTVVEKSESCDSSNCLQVWSIAVPLSAGSCYFTGTYAYSVSAGCYAGYTSPCPFENTTAMITDSVVSENACAVYASGITLTATMASYSDASLTIPKTSFANAEGGYFKISATSSSGSIQSLTVDSFYTSDNQTTTFLVSSGSVTASGAKAGYAVSVISGSVISIYYVPSTFTNSAYPANYQPFTAYAVIRVSYSGLRRSALATVKLASSDGYQQLISNDYSVQVAASSGSNQQPTTMSAAEQHLSNALIVAIVLFVSLLCIF